MFFSSVGGFLVKEDFGFTFFTLVLTNLLEGLFTLGLLWLTCSLGAPLEVCGLSKDVLDREGSEVPHELVAS